jgi:hypothetical protein
MLPVAEKSLRDLKPRLRNKAWVPKWMSEKQDVMDFVKEVPLSLIILKKAAISK